jgi:eukaryotic-like serine/threonine-protein kinase
VQASALAALWTVTPSATPTPSQTYTPTATLPPSQTSTPSRTFTPSQTSTPRFTPTPKAGDTLVSEKDGMVIVWVSEGEFIMGSDTGDNNEKPVHTVYLDGYWMDRTEVTNGMYALCVAAGQCKNQAVYANDSQKKDHPAVAMDWYNADAYCKWAGRRLPTEAQWEKAARGTDARTYPWGEGINCDKANYRGCKGDTTAVGSYLSGASPYGIWDMAGNVWEWVADWYDRTYYRNSANRNPQGPNSAQKDSRVRPPARVQRGGSYHFDENSVRSTYRYGEFRDSRYHDSGFRCSLSP